MGTYVFDQIEEYKKTDIPASASINTLTNLITRLSKVKEDLQTLLISELFLRELCPKTYKELENNPSELKEAANSIHSSAFEAQDIKLYHSFYLKVDRRLNKFLLWFVNLESPSVRKVMSDIEEFLCFSEKVYQKLKGETTVERIKSILNNGPFKKDPYCQGEGDYLIWLHKEKNFVVRLQLKDKKRSKAGTYIFGLHKDRPLKENGDYDPKKLTRTSKNEILKASFFPSITIFIPSGMDSNFDGEWDDDTSLEKIIYDEKSAIKIYNGLAKQGTDNSHLNNKMNENLKSPKSPKK